MPAVKRSAQIKAPAAKRTKSSNPLEKNFEIVLSALSDDEAVVPCREMFIAIAEAVLKVPKSDRHEDQTTSLNMMREVFMSEKSRWEGRISEAQSVTDAAEQERTEKMAAKDAEDAKVKAQKDVLKEKRAALEQAEEVVKECEGEVRTANKEHASTMKAQQDINEEKEHALTVQESLNVLKDGTCEVPKEVKKHLAAITSLFKMLEVEEALIKALPQVLCQKPSERGSFDEISLKQMEENLSKHLKSLDEKIEVAGVHVSDAGIAITAWDAALEVAKEKSQECDTAVGAAEAELEELQKSLASARKVLKEQTAAVKRTEESLAAEQMGLENTEKVLNSLEFLFEYEAPAPEVTEELKSKEMESVATDMPSPARQTMEVECA